MVQILILLAMIPLALLGLRLVFALAKGFFGLVFFGLAMVLVVSLGTSNHPAKNNDQSKERVPLAVEPIRASEVDCSDVDQMLIGSFGIGELCDRYYKGEQCKPEIEAGFVRSRLQLSPVDLCGSPQPALLPEPPLLNRLDQKALAF